MLAKFALALLLAAGPKGRVKAPEPSPAPPAPVGEERVLKVTDENANGIFPVSVLFGRSTWIVFPSAVKPPLSAKAELGPDLAGNILILTPGVPIATDQRFPLVVHLEDGGPPIVFEVRGATSSFDARLTIERQLQRRISAESPQALAEALQLCRKELDDFSKGGRVKDVRAAAIAAVPEGRTAVLVRHDLRASEQQNFVWAKVRHSYRLFDFTFAVLDVSNRQEGTLWVLRGASVRQSGQDGETLPVVIQNDRPQGIPAGDTARVVVGFATPADNTRRLDITLEDDAGSRNVVLSNLAL